MEKISTLGEIRFVCVPGGSFEMGDGESLQAQPIHRVRVSPFRLGETPVTNEQYAVFLKQAQAKEPAYWQDRRFSSPNQPVVGVSWEEAQAFCRWFGETCGHDVTLPSEAQWEFAARGPEGRIFPWGNEPPDETRACFGLDRRTGKPAAVDSYREGRGPFGTLNQAGNVWEWCQDAWDDKSYSERADARQEVVDPVIKGREDSARILRGGGWADLAPNLRAASRLPRKWKDDPRPGFPARGRDDDFGFRLAAARASP